MASILETLLLLQISVGIDTGENLKRNGINLRVLCLIVIKFYLFIYFLSKMESMDDLICLCFLNVLFEKVF
jgi:hypothetical protein